MFYSDRRAGALDPEGGCDWLAWIILQDGRDPRLTTQGWAGPVFNLFEKKGCLGQGTLSVGAEMRADTSS